MAFTHVGTKYIKRQQDFDNFLKFRHTLVDTPFNKQKQMILKVYISKIAAGADGIVEAKEQQVQGFISCLLNSLLN